MLAAPFVYMFTDAYNIICLYVNSTIKDAHNYE